MRTDPLILTLIRDTETLGMVKVVMGGEGHHVIEIFDSQQAFSLLQNGLRPYLIFVESDRSNPIGQEHYRELVRHSPRNSVCMILGLGETALLQHLRALGIQRFLMKPVTRQDLESVVSELPDPIPSKLGLADFQPPECAAQVSIEGGPTLPYLEELDNNHFFLAASPSMLEIYRQVKLLAEVNVPVLILGESGTGKEVIARLIHRHSRRAKQTFLNVNCAALPMDLLESELFGHQQGAFTGAIKDKPGKFELANRGTLLLDEIGEISPQMQAKLLHVLQDGQFTRLGGQQAVKVDLQILAATNIDMEEALTDKTFREDLYYRLNTFTIRVPPLRDRREEIPYLMEETMRRTPSEMRAETFDRVSTRLMDAAMQYDWPGNLRELRNFITRTTIMQDQEEALRELEQKINAQGAFGKAPRMAAVAAPRSGMRSIVRDVKARTEMRMIQEALDAAGWNRRHAARDLNISYRALLYKIQQHQLTPGMPRI